MKLSYRGLDYALQAITIDTIETELVGRFRGYHYTIRRPVNVLSHHTRAKKYRGVAYS